MDYYNIKKIIPDGNCLFRALSVFLYDTEDSCSIMWERIVKRVIDNWSIYKFFIVGGVLYSIPIADESDRFKLMSKDDGTYDGHLELNAATRIYNIFIKHYQSQNDDSVKELGVNARGKIKVNLLYEGNRDKNFYVLLEKKKWKRKKLQ